MIKRTDKIDWGEQNAHGVDVAQLRYNLSLTNEEKVVQHDRALQFMIQCRKVALDSGKPILPNPDLDYLVRLYEERLVSES